MCVCVCVCIYYVYICVYTYVYIYIYMCVCMYVYIYIQLHNICLVPGSRSVCGSVESLKGSPCHCTIGAWQCDRLRLGVQTRLSAVSLGARPSAVREVRHPWVIVCICICLYIYTL